MAVHMKAEYKGSQNKSDYNWDKVASKLIHESDNKLWRKHSDRVNNDLLFRWLPEVKRQIGLKTDLFDEAVSDGLLPVMKRRAAHIFGMDLSESVLSKVKASHLTIKSVCADARRLPFANNVFDFVVSNSTLDHFSSNREIETAILEIRRVLKPGGHLILTLDNPVNPVLALRRFLPFKFLRQIGLLPYYVGKTYGPWRLRAVLKRMGMDVLETTAVMHFPRILVVVIGKLVDTRWDGRMSGLILKFIMTFEMLSKLPFRYFTGYFVAAKARKK
jgi:SAM-dependent methyltransferase